VHSIDLSVGHYDAISLVIVVIKEKWYRTVDLVSRQSAKIPLMADSCTVVT